MSSFYYSYSNGKLTIGRIEVERIKTCDYLSQEVSEIIGLTEKDFREDVTSIEIESFEQINKLMELASSCVSP